MRSPELPPNAEPLRDACLGLLYHLLRFDEDFDEDQAESSIMELGKHALKRNLLLADYAERSADLHPEVRAFFDRSVIESLGARRRTEVWRELANCPKVEEPFDVAILTILREELEATVRAFGAQKDRSLPIDQPFYRASVVRDESTNEPPLSVVITQAAKPLNVHAHRPVAEIREQYLPKIIFLVGIAAGLEGKLNLGDVAVPRKILYYEPEKMTAEGLRPRPEHTEPREYLFGFGVYNPEERGLSDKIRAFVEALPDYQRPNLDRAEFRPSVESVNVTIAAGERVLRDGAYLAELQRRFDETICAADQESYGFAEAARNLPWLVFRGVSDHGDPVKRDDWKYAAAGAAAVCLRDFLESTSYVRPGLPNF
ncbi:5'-methylthioadenosine/S-adenosylhomocysteine nucleosidase family protein [Actinomadura sp. 3N407]|uniref:5'-methylthioadenosine/S-adenosylhomocysteine nucleosidase family protein n=1 Tax=Actinomadura sp. 3N407 TaxID=3457423 RepID=UPI003FCCAB2A